MYQKGKRNNPSVYNILKNFAQEFLATYINLLFKLEVFKMVVTESISIIAVFLATHHFHSTAIIGHFYPKPVREGYRSTGRDNLRERGL